MQAKNLLPLDRCWYRIQYCCWKIKFSKHQKIGLSFFFSQIFSSVYRMVSIFLFVWLFSNLQKDKSGTLNCKVMFMLHGCAFTSREHFLRKTKCSYLRDSIWNLKLQKFTSKSWLEEFLFIQTEDKNIVIATFVYHQQTNSSLNDKHT